MKALSRRSADGTEMIVEPSSNGRSAGAIIGFAGRLRGMAREEPEPSPSPLSPPMASGTPVSRFGGALVRLSVRIVPLHIALVIILGAVRGWLLPMAGGADVTAITIIVVAVGATMLPVPTGARSHWGSPPHSPSGRGRCPGPGQTGDTPSVVIRARVPEGPGRFNVGPSGRPSPRSSLITGVRKRWLLKDVM
jgi:hypothetical protein